MAVWSESTAPSCHDHTFAVAIQPLGPHHHDGEGLFVKLAGFFRCGLNFGKMLFRRGGMLYLFEISKKEAFRICMGWVGGGRRPYFCGNQGVCKYIHIYIVIVIVMTTYHAVSWSYRASRNDMWFLPCSIPWVPELPEVAHSLTEDPEDRGYRPTRLSGQWQLQSVGISNGDGRWPVCSPGVRGKA